MLHLEVNGLQNKISQLQKQLWQNQVRSQVLMFGGQNAFSGGNDSCFYHMFKKIFSEHDKICGDTIKL